jgi:hypothetical protein
MLDLRFSVRCSGFRRRAVRRQPDVSDERTVSIFRVEKLRKKPAEHELSLSASASFMFGLLFDSEDEGDMFLRNVELSLNYSALQLKRHYFPFIVMPTRAPSPTSPYPESNQTSSLALVSELVSY